MRKREEKRGIPEAIIQPWGVCALFSVRRMELSRAMPQYIHAVVAVLAHGILFFGWPACIGDGEVSFRREYRFLFRQP